ncbi:MAG: PAS domain-containing protein [Oscillochloris sp.]|nr:PAS domain-containing protein [Oscillochloris sp.]
MVITVLINGIVANLAAILGLYIWRHRYYRGGRPFVLLMAALAWWCACQVVSILDPTFAGTVFWSLLQFGGIVLVGPTWFLLALAYSGQWWRTYRWFRWGLFAPELFFFAVALSNELHGLWWSAVQPAAAGGFLSLMTVRGPVFWLHTVYAYLCILAGMGMLMYAAFFSTQRDRGHVRQMLLAVFIPVVGNILFLLGVSPPSIGDPTALLMFISAALAFYNTRYNQLVDLAPLVDREVFSGLPDGLIVLDSRGKIADMNSAALRLLRMGHQRWAGRLLREVLAESPLIDEIVRFISVGMHQRAQQLILDQDDGILALELRMRPLQAANGSTTGTLLLLRDISEGVRAEHERARRVAEQGLISSVARAANSASETDGLIRTVAATILKSSDWDRVSVGLVAPNGADFRIVADESHDEAESYAGRVAGGPYAAELSALMEPGRTRAICLHNGAYADSSLAERLRAVGLRSLVTVPLYHREQPLGLLALSSSGPAIAEPERLQLAETIGELIIDAVMRTRLYEEARQAERLKASFLAVVSHELRTPLTTIIGYCDMLQRGTFGRAEDGMQEAFVHMRHSSINLLQLINDILDFSRMESGHLQVDLQAVDVHWTIHTVTGQFQPQIRERELELRTEIADDLPLVLANSRRIEQVLINLVSNAIKFSDQGTVIIKAHRHRGGVRLSVIDGGIGIAPENLEAIFQEFRRVETPNGRRYGGSGLGLAIVRRLTELMCGRISVESTIGAGSRFHVDLRVADAAGDSMAQPFSQAAD